MWNITPYVIYRMSNETYRIRCGTNSLSSVDAYIDVKPLPE